MKQIDIDKLIIKLIYGGLTDFSPLEVALETGESTLDKLLAEDPELSSSQKEAARDIKRLILKEKEVPEYNGEFIKVESSNLDSLAYNKEEKKILVKFKQGTVYSYEDCEEEDFKYIINAMSAGSAFSDFKKKHIRYSRLK